LDFTKKVLKESKGYTAFILDSCFSGQFAKKSQAGTNAASKYDFRACSYGPCPNSVIFKETSDGTEQVAAPDMSGSLSECVQLNSITSLKSLQECTFQKYKEAYQDPMIAESNLMLDFEPKKFSNFEDSEDITLPFKKLQTIK